MPRDFPWRRFLPLAALLASISVYTALILIQARSQHAVTMVDYWYHLQSARALSLTRLETWVHPFYPVGYFALLRIGLDLGLDVARYGQFLSWSGSIGGIVAVYLLLYTATRKAILALAGVALLILHPFYRFQALQEGNDMLAAGLQLLALAVVFSDVSPESLECRRESNRLLQHFIDENSSRSCLQFDGYSGRTGGERGILWWFGHCTYPFFRAWRISS